MRGAPIVIDPFLINNPKTPAAWKSLDALGKVDLVLVTHAHADHLADAPALARKRNVPLWGPPGLDGSLVALGVLPAESDTTLFADMKFIAEYYEPDLVLIPMGGHFVMSPQDAAYATREYLRPKMAIPMHYGTFPMLKGTPQEYIQALGPTATKVVPLNPGEALVF